jgi:hypothetical protein
MEMESGEARAALPFHQKNGGIRIFLSCSTKDLQEENIRCILVGRLYGWKWGGFARGLSKKTPHSPYPRCID